MPGTGQQLTRIVEVQRKYTDMLMKKPHVVGLSIGPLRKTGKTNGDYALIVMVDEAVPPEQVSPEEQIPAELDGVPVVVREVGTIQAL
jgi:hypothetical protein